MYPLPGDIATKALSQLRQGKSCPQVSESLGISLGVVIKIRKKNIDSIPPSKVGRPSKVSKVTKRLLARKYDQGELTTLRQGRKAVEKIQGISVDERTVRSYIREEGLKTYIQPKKPDLTEEQMDVRYRFAKTHLQWTVEDWKKVMFSDEVSIHRVEPFGRKFYYKKPENRKLRSSQVKRTKQGGGGKISVWGCMTYHGVGDACWIPGNLNSSSYVDILQENMLASRDWYNMIPSDFVFQHDNSSVHTSKVVTEYIKKHGINVLKWPSNSPDLNPTENLWAHIKYQLDQYEDPPSTLDELWGRVEDIWTEVSMDYLHELYESMPRRMKALHYARGGHIKY